MKRNKTIDIIISVIIAVALWVYVINIVNPLTKLTIKQIPVSITGQEALEERGFAVKGDLNYTVSLSVSGSRSDIEHLSASDFAATADIAGLAQGNTFINVSVVGPKNVNIDDISEENIAVRVEDFVTETKAVRLIAGTAEEGLELTVIDYPSSAEVKGAKSDVATVTYVKIELPAQAVDLDNIKTVNLPAYAIDGGGAPAEGVELVNESLPVEAVIYAVKSVQLITNVSGEPLFGIDSYKGMDVNTAITIKGSTDALASINSIYSEDVDITGLSTNSTFTLKPLLPDGVFLSKTQGPILAKVFIEKPAEDEEPENPEEGVEGETSDAAITKEE